MLKLGHRGAPGYPRRFENTMISFQRALWLGADGFELDVRRCKTELVVFHDATIERMTNGLSKIALADFEHAELNNRISKMRGVFQKFRIPSLFEVLLTFGSRCLINIEIKECGLTEDILWLVRKIGLQRTVIVSCFDKTLEHADEINSPSWNDLKDFSPFVQTGLIANGDIVKRMGNDYIARAKELGASAIHPHYSAISGKLMRNAKVAGLTVNAWTVNNRFAIWKMRMLNVHGIISDFPERL
ncbi:MAG: glycerophosphodiester phosphodiesterase family protein [Patescibacteria group bacterium]